MILVHKNLMHSLKGFTIYNFSTNPKYYYIEVYMTNTYV